PNKFLVALLYIDICGPSNPKIMGIEGEEVHLCGSGWSPVYAEENLSVMSVGFLLSGPDDAVIWRGPQKNGTSDEHLLCISKFRIHNHYPSGKRSTEINFCHKVKLPIIGGVENMSGFICPKCEIESQIFAPTTGGREMMCQKLNISFLGKVPLDPQIGKVGKSCDKGQSFLSEIPESPATSSYRNIIQRIQEYCGLHHSQEKLSNQGME
uniref:Uncharacterized protein n=1 Tax=Chelonoidis abingdonii TaxID=106734 RepID=A0A8C0IXX2_CHEAB